MSGLKRFIRSYDRFKYNFNLQQPALVQYYRRYVQMEVVEDYQPHILILLVGTNDIYDVDLPPETLVKQIMALVDDIISLPKVQKCLLVRFSIVWNQHDGLDIRLTLCLSMRV